MLIRYLLALTVVVLGLSSCSTQVRSTKPVVYQFQAGKTAMLQGNVAYAPASAPKKVKLAVEAANRLTRKPYKWGGGHSSLNDSGYDCSGAVSYVLREAGLMKGANLSNGFYRYGKKGPGDWISIYTKRGHVFMTIAGLRFDTGGDGARTGPRWKPKSRTTRGCVVRHPAGF